MRRVSILAIVVGVSTLIGCVPVRPLAEARDALGRGQVLRVGEQEVFVEMSGRGEAVVLLHGFAASSYSWRKVLPELARDFLVVAPDLNGFGLTERPPDPRHYTREGQIDLVLRIMDTLGIDSAHLIGHSYGGSLTLALAADHPERVRSMTLVDSAAPEYPDKRRNWLRSRRLLSFAFVRGLALRPSHVERAIRRAYHDDDLVTDEVVEAYRERLRVEGIARSYRMMTRPLRGPRPPRLDYEMLELPALVVWGDDDKLVSAETGRAHAERLPDFRFVTIEDSGHSPMEERPQEFLSAVKSFLGEVASAPGDRISPQPRPGP